MRHPFDFIQQSKWTKIFFLLLGLSFLIIAVMQLTGALLITDAAPYGIISFELAGSVTKIEKILASWDTDTMVRAAFALGFDFLFIPVYVSTIVLLCGIIANALQKNKRPISSLGSFLAWGVIFAGLMDIVENVALVKIIFGTVASPWPEIALWSAILKFSLIIFGLVFIIYGSVLYLIVSKNRNTE